MCVCVCVCVLCLAHVFTHTHTRAHADRLSRCLIPLSTSYTPTLTHTYPHSQTHLHTSSSHTCTYAVTHTHTHTHTRTHARTRTHISRPHGEMYPRHPAEGAKSDLSGDLLYTHLGRELLLLGPTFLHTFACVAERCHVNRTPDSENLFFFPPINCWGSKRKMASCCTSLT